MSKVSILTTSDLNHSVRIILLWTTQFSDFEHGLHSNLTNTIETLELDASFDNPNAVIYLFSLGFLCLVSIIYVSSKLQGIPSSKLCKLLCQDRVLLLSAPVVDKMSASTSIHYFPVIQQHYCLSTDF